MEDLQGIFISLITLKYYWPDGKLQKLAHALNYLISLRIEEHV